MAANFSYDVFLSHNSKDKPRVRRLAERLKQAGLRVWFDEWMIKPGDDIYLAIERGLEAARVQVLCLSPAALGSEWVTLERSTVLFRDPTNKGRRFIPLLLADCELPDTLRRYKYVDFREEAEAAFAEVLAACQVQTTDSSALSPPEPVKTVRPPLIKRVIGQEHPHQVSNLREKRSDRVKPAEHRQIQVLLESSFIAHKAEVRLAISPDGTWFTSGSQDGTLKTWNLPDCKLRTAFDGHSSAIRCTAISRDGNYLASGSNDTTICVWDAATGHRVFEAKGHREYVRAVSFSLGQKILSGSFDGTLRLWDISSKQCLREFTADGAPIWSVAVSPDGNKVISGDSNGHLTIWNLGSDEWFRLQDGHSGIVRSVNIEARGRLAVSGAEDKTVRIWDLEAGTCVATLEGHGNYVSAVAFRRDDALIASASFSDKTIRLWNSETGECLVETQIGHSPESVGFTPDGSRLVVGTGRGKILIYRLHLGVTASSPEVRRRYVNAKVVLLGEGTVGKTSLAHRLIDDKYVIKDRTHGMNVWRLELPLSPDATLEREALLWDLAGQEDYRLIHQLFLDETALALLLINPQKDDPFAEAGDWLKALKTASDSNSNREAEKLLVYSQVDVGGPKLSDAKIDEFRKRYGFSDWLLTSAKSGRNCSDKKNKGEPSKLKQLIAESIPWDKLPWTSTPRLLAELKNAVVAMREERDIRLLRFAELAQRLEQALPGEKFGESEVRTAVTLLSNHGLARPLKFGDLVLLQPELLNGYAGAIIRAARAHTDEIGCVLEADIYRPGFDFTGVERLKHRPDEELLLRALVQTFLDHSLCIAEDTPQGRQLVFPSQYRREKDIPHDPNILVSYTFSGEWQTVWTTLVVRLWYSQEFEHRELWRNAAEFASPKGYTLGLKIDNQQGEGTATISLYFDVRVEDDLKAIFIEFVHRHLAKFGCEVSRDRRYVCPNPKCSTPVTNLDAVRRRLEAKKTFIICQECDKKVPLIDFIEQRLKSDPVARKIMAMDEVATRELDSQALEQILIGHMMAIAGEANQIFRPVTMFDHGIDGEVEFKDNDGKASGKRIYIQLKSGNSYLRTRKSDGSEVFDVTNERHLEYWVSQPVDVYLVIRQTDETTGGQTIRWMNVTRYLTNRKDKLSRQIVFEGEKLDMAAVWKVRDRFFRESQRRK